MDKLAISQPSTTVFTSRRVILKPLTIADADAYHQLYASLYSPDEMPFLPNETAAEFTSRIIGACAYAFTIREFANSETIVGDCALHHWNKQDNEAEVGGLLLPQYWGKGLMKEAFAILYDFASRSIHVSTVLASTSINNTKAIRFAEKDGFVQYKLDNGFLILKKDITGDR